MLKGRERNALHPAGGFPERDFLALGLDLEHREAFLGDPDAPDQVLEGHVGQGMRLGQGQAQEVEHVDDLGLFPERAAGFDHVRDLMGDQLFDHDGRLGVRPVEDGDFLGRGALEDQLLDLGDDFLGLGELVGSLHLANLLALGGAAGFDGLLDLLGVMGDEPVGQLDDGRGRTIVLGQEDALGLGEVPVVREDIVEVRGAEPVDALRVVADREEVVLRGRQESKERVLRLVRVLVFVDEHVGVLGLDLGANVIVKL
ncbi:hypothetical protein D3C87_983180 [compost metagenome]